LPLLIAVPLMLLLAAQFWPPLQALTLSLPMPLTLYIAAAAVGSLILLMRQWGWLYWLGLAAGHLLTLQLIPTPGLALPIITSSAMVLLAILPRPPLPTCTGFFVVISISLLPAIGSLSASYDWQFASLPAVRGVLDTIPEIKRETFLAWMFAFQALVWAFLMYSNTTRNAEHWGQLMCWSVIAAMYLLENQPGITEWSLVAFCCVILLALSMQMLHLAYVDELTQLPQRRALQRHLKRLGRSSAVTMLDVDHFKKFNDTYGHDVGDQVLRLLGSILRKERGLSAYRYGGEEFTLVFSHNDPQKLKQKLEAVRNKVADYPMEIRKPNRPRNTRKGQQQRTNKKSGTSRRVKITISLGCAVRQKGETAEMLIQRADKALYAAKNAGRNCAVLSR
jgi:diguanylate cyclase (GGDEF)-like protein